MLQQLMIKCQALLHLLPAEAAVSAVAVAAAALDEGLPTQGSQLAAEQPEAKAPTKRQNAQTHASSKKKQPNEHVAAADSASLPTPRGATSAASDSESD